jgi:hypothetical protein
VSDVGEQFRALARPAELSDPAEVRRRLAWQHLRASQPSEAKLQRVIGMAKASLFEPLLEPAPDEPPAGWPDGQPARRRRRRKRREARRRASRSEVAALGVPVHPLATVWRVDARRWRVTNPPAVVNATLASLTAAADSARRRPRPGSARQVRTPVVAATVTPVFEAEPLPRGDTRLEVMASFARGLFDRMSLVAAAEANAEAQAGPVAKLADRMGEFLDRPQPEVVVKAPDVYVDLAAPAAPSVTVKPPDVHVHVEQPKSRPRAVRIEYDEQGNKRYVSEEIEDDPA